MVLSISLIAVSAAGEEVRLKKADQVTIQVFEEPSLSGVFEVGPNGGIVFPLLGRIDAVGKRAQEVEDDIESQLEDGYIRDAQVAVAISKESVLPPHSVTVLGLVSVPGRVDYPSGEDMDLFAAISSAGGISHRGNPNRIELKRRSEGGLQTRYMSLSTSGASKLQHGDTLIVHPKLIAAVEVSTVTIIGEVKSPGKLMIEQDKPLDLIGAIASAGGFTNMARASKVIVRRMNGEQVITLEYNVSKMQRTNAEPVYLQNGDTVTVPESIF